MQQGARVRAEAGEDGHKRPACQAKVSRTGGERKTTACCAVQIIPAMTYSQTLFQWQWKTIAGPRARAGLMAVPVNWEPALDKPNHLCHLGIERCMSAWTTVHGGQGSVGAGSHDKTHQQTPWQRGTDPLQRDPPPRRKAPQWQQHTLSIPAQKSSLSPIQKACLRHSMAYILSQPLTASGSLLRFVSIACNAASVSACHQLRGHGLGFCLLCLSTETASKQHACRPRRHPA